MCTLRAYTKCCSITELFKYFLSLCCITRRTVSDTSHHWIPRGNMLNCFVILTTRTLEAKPSSLINRMRTVMSNHVISNPDWDPAASEAIILNSDRMPRWQNVPFAKEY